MDVEFINVNEIRMASPFNLAERLIVHGWPKKFKKWQFQDKYFYDSEKEICVLIKWDINKNNSPGFRPILLIKKTGNQIELNRIKGCCKSVTIEGENIVLDVFRSSGDERIKINLQEEIMK